VPAWVGDGMGMDITGIMDTGMGTIANQVVDMVTKVTVRITNTDMNFITNITTIIITQCRERCFTGLIKSGT